METLSLVYLYYWKHHGLNLKFWRTLFIVYPSFLNRNCNYLREIQMDCCTHPISQKLLVRDTMDSSALLALLALLCSRSYFMNLIMDLEVSLSL